MDFQFDATTDDCTVKFSNVIDEHSRLCLELLAGSVCKGKDVVTMLEGFTSLYPSPGFIRSDNV